MLTKLAAALALTLGCAAVAHADPNPAPNGPFADLQTASLSVAVSDLNLDRADGAEIALRRLRQAAQAICGPQPAMRNLDAKAAWRACVNTTLDQAVAAANRPQITALHAPAQPSRLASVRPQ